MRIKIIVLLLVVLRIYGLDGLAGYFKSKSRKLDWRLVGISKSFEGNNIKVCGIKVKRCVKVKVVKRWYNSNEIIRLSKRAFLELAPLKAGLVKVKIGNIRRLVNTKDREHKIEGKFFKIKFKIKLGEK